MGIISLLDENCLIAESTDQSTLEKLNKYMIDKSASIKPKNRIQCLLFCCRYFGNHPHYQSYATVKDRSIPNDCFRLKHYAGDVRNCF
jgi:myosin heavy subunit